MKFFKWKVYTCPLCGEPMEAFDGSGHIALRHMEDAVPGNPSGGLQLLCGCPSEIYDVSANFPELARRHLETKHHLVRS